LVLLVAFTLLGCPSGQKYIQVDTTGMTPEQVQTLEWRVKYAVALDWYDYELKSYKTTLDALPKEDAQKIHDKVWPLFKTAKASIDVLETVSLSGDPDKSAEAYESFLTVKSKILMLMTKLLAE
jgi:hypothetical protein